MSIKPIAFKAAEIEAQKLEKVTTQPKIELRQENDKVELAGKKQKPVRSFWGSVGAYFASSFVLAAHFLTSFPILNGMKKANNYTEEQVKTLHDAINQMNVDSGLKEKGVKLRFLNPLKENIIDDIPKDKDAFVDKAVKYFEKFDRNYSDNSVIRPVRAGENAFFLGHDAKLTTLKLSECIKIFKEEGWKAMREKMKATHKTYIRANSVVLPQKGMAGAGFHELGHALNFNMSKFGKFLQKSRLVSMIAPSLLVIYGAVTRASKPKEEGKDLNGAQKTHNFVRNNAGKLALAASLPILVEEGMATIKGQKYAKKFLTPDLAKRVFKGNAIAYLSYISLAVFSALAATTAVKVKDAAIQNKTERIAEKEAIAKQIEEELKANAEAV